VCGTSETVDFLKGAQSRKGFCYNWLLNNAGNQGLDDELSRFEKGKATPNDLLRLAEFGFGIVGGFRRLVDIEPKGFDMKMIEGHRLFIGRKIGLIKSHNNSYGRFAESITLFRNSVRYRIVRY
jgi:hypothetical protein